VIANADVVGGDSSADQPSGVETERFVDDSLGVFELVKGGIVGFPYRAVVWSEDVVGLGA
jgi:hypothetical protein